MSEAITIKGLKETSAALDELDRKAQRSIIRKGLRAGCKPWLSAARADAPEVSGRAKRNIKIRAGGTRKGNMRMTVGVNKKDFAGPAFYLGFLLFGHRVGRRALGNARKLVPANNFLMRAYDGGKDAAAGIAVDTWLELIDAEANKV